MQILIINDKWSPCEESCEVASFVDGSRKEYSMEQLEISDNRVVRNTNNNRKYIDMSINNVD